MRMAPIDASEIPPEASDSRLALFLELEANRSMTFVTCRDQVSDYLSGRDITTSAELEEKDINFLNELVTGFNSSMPHVGRVVELRSPIHFVRSIDSLRDDNLVPKSDGGNFVGVFLGFAISDYIMDQQVVPLCLVARTHVIDDDGVPCLFDTPLSYGEVVPRVPELN